LQGYNRFQKEFFLQEQNVMQKVIRLISSSRLTQPQSFNLLTWKFRSFDYVGDGKTFRKHIFGGLQNTFFHAFLLGKIYGMHIVAKVLHLGFVAHKLSQRQKFFFRQFRVTGYERKVNSIFEHRLGSFQNALLLGKGYGMHVVAEILHFPFVAHKLLLFKIRNFRYLEKLPELSFAKAARLFGELVAILKREKQPVKVVFALPLLSESELARIFRIYRIKFHIGHWLLTTNILLIFLILANSDSDSYDGFFEDSFEEGVEEENEQVLALLVRESLLEGEIEREGSELALRRKLGFANKCLSGHNASYRKLLPFCEGNKCYIKKGCLLSRASEAAHGANIENLRLEI
jgi:DNA-directed RNA polymerase subunit F